MKKGVLLVNLGTPSAPTSHAVKKYLIEFLTDHRVIDLPWLQRQLLVRGLIIPKRLNQSIKSYKSIWTKEGSPLMVHSMNTKRLVQKALGENYQVEFGMRYQSPSIETALSNLFNEELKELIILPLFPQYASATTGSIYEKAFKELSKKLTLPKITFIDQFHINPKFIQSFQAVSASYNFKEYDHILFSFHGLPERQLKKSGKSGFCMTCDCCNRDSFKNANCYAAQCYRTAHAIAETCSIEKTHYSVCFQSRLGKEPWIKPFTNDRIQELAKNHSKILVFCPSFVADCLETIYEISIEYQELFQQFGGKTLDLVPGLNTHPFWINALKELIESHSSIQ